MAQIGKHGDRKRAHPANHPGQQEKTCGRDRRQTRDG
jgi:hypothetical protein